MKERPILFSGEMIRALLSGRKTQTRRILKDQDAVNFVDNGVARTVAIETPKPVISCPYGQPGDRLVVKEAAWMWCAKVVSRTEVTKKTGKPKVAWVECRNVPPIYCADHPAKPAHVPEGKSAKVGNLEYCWHKKNARFLPRWASRGLDEVVSIRIQRLQDISEADAIAEGIEEVPAHMGSKRYWKNYLFETAHPRKGVEVTSDQHRILAFGDPRESYRSLWESISGPGSWELNPWVWVVEFKVVEGGASA